MEEEDDDGDEDKEKVEEPIEWIISDFGGDMGPQFQITRETEEDNCTRWSE